MSAESAKEWMRKASIDYNEVMLDVPLSLGRAELVCFHIQQCIEKLFKAVLSYENIRLNVHTISGICLMKYPSGGK